MSDATGVDRRGFLRGAGSAALVGALPSAFGAVLAACAPRSETLRSALTGFFDDAVAARKVGAVVLESLYEDRDADEVVARLARARFGEWEGLADRPERLAEQLREQHRDDFAAGRVLEAHGWRLSETESLLCSLAALGA
jgi:hypothetical protein